MLAEAERRFFGFCWLSSIGCCYQWGHLLFVAHVLGQSINAGRGPQLLEKLPLDNAADDELVIYYVITT